MSATGVYGDSKDCRWRRARALPLLLAVATVLLGVEGAEEDDRFDTVVIDAGHGGEDEGAIGPLGTFEKRLVLSLTTRLAERLRKDGLRVVLTRDSDVFVPLETRTAIANDARGDLFISIHGNAAENSGVRGTETYFLALDATDDSAREVAARENRAFSRPASPEPDALRDPLIAVLGDLIATEYLRESSEFARFVQTELGRVESLHSRGVKQALFVVLSGVQMPAALVEVGFVTNPRDERTLASAKGQKEVVDALSKAVAAFGKRYNARHGSPPIQTDE